MPSPKDFSTLSLIGLAIVITALFIRVVQPLILPLMLAAVMAVLFFPAFRRIRQVCRGHSRIAAGVTTVLILLVVLLPLSGGVMLAGLQLLDATKEVSEDLDLPEEASKLINGTDDGASPSWWQDLKSRMSKEELEEVRKMASEGVSAAIKMTYEKTTSLVAGTFSFVVGLVIVLLALYYFLAENEKLLAEIERLSPLDEEDDRVFWNNFVEVSRGVMLGNVAAALFQAVLNGVGFAVLGVEQALLLGFATFFLSLIPFIGAFSVWGCVAIGLALSGEYGKAGILAIYGLLIVSSIDNLIRAHWLQGHGRLHPLVALVSIIGALQLVGFLGIFVGPIVAAFFFAMLEIIRKKMKDPRTELQIPGSL